MSFKERISVLVDVDTKGASGGLKTFSSSIKEADGFTNKFKAGASSAFGKVSGAAKGLALAAGASLIAFGDQILNSGVAMESMAAKAKTVFGNSLGMVEKWASESAASMGLTESSAVGAAAAMADLLKPMGFTSQAAAEMSVNMVDLSGALAAWSGGTYDAAQVSEILSKAMLGEREQLKSLGISITEADVSARLLTNGQKGLTGAALAQAKALATQQLIMEKSTDAQIAWNDGSMDGAKSANETKAAMAELQSTLVAQLMPALQSLVPILADVAEILEPVVGLLDDALAPVVALSEGINKIDWSKPFENGGKITEFKDRIAELTAEVEQGSLVTEVAAKYNQMAADAMTEGEKAAADLITKQRGLSGETRRTKEAMQGVATATNNAAYEYDQLTGKLDNREAWLNLQQSMEDHIATMGDSEVADRDKELSLIGLQKELADYASGLEGIPPEKKTEVLALIDQGKLNDAAWILGVLTTDRDVRINPVIGKGANGTFVIGQIGSNKASATGTTNSDEGWHRVDEQGYENIYLPRGSRVTPAGETQRAAQAAAGAGGAGPTFVTHLTMQAVQTMNPELLLRQTAEVIDRQNRAALMQMRAGTR